METLKKGIIVAGFFTITASVLLTLISMIWLIII